MSSTSTQSGEVGGAISQSDWDRMSLAMKDIQEKAERGLKYLDEFEEDYMRGIAQSRSMFEDVLNKLNDFKNLIAGNNYGSGGSNLFKQEVKTESVLMQNPLFGVVIKTETQHQQEVQVKVEVDDDIGGGNYLVKEEY